MPLEIKVITYKDQQPAQPLSAFFGEEGGIIGKNADNDLILPDPNNIVSRKHAIISYQNNQFLLEDISGNGTYICNRDSVLHHKTMKLSDGDEIKIGDYKLYISITNIDKAETLQPHSSPMKQEDLLSAFDIDKSGISDIDTDNEMIYNGSPIDEPITPPSPERMPTSFDFKDLLRDSDDTINTTPDVNNEIGKAQRLEKSEFHTMSTESPVNPQLDKDVNQRSDKELFDIFLGAAGIKDKKFYNEAELPEIMENIGKIFREMVKGMMNILEGRAEQKKEIRADMTIVRRTENNPLKQLPAAEDAIKQLITNLHPGFLTGVDAVQEGCSDIMAHHLAMTSGLQASLKKLIKQFDPQLFEEKHQNGIALSRKFRCWDDYSQAYPQMAKELIDNIYGDSFAKAYDAQIRKLRKKSN